MATDPEHAVGQLVPRIQGVDVPADGGAGITKGSHTQTDGIEHRNAHTHHRHHRYAEQQEHGHEIGKDGLRDARAKRLIAQANRYHGTGMQHLAKLVDHHLPGGEDAHALHAATRRASTGTHQGDKQQGNPRTGVPLLEILRGEARGRAERGHLESGCTETVLDAKAINHVEANCTINRKEKENTGVKPDFCIAPNFTETALDDQQIKEREVDSAGRHKYYLDVFYQGRLKIGHAVLMGAESAR